MDMDRPKGNTQKIVISALIIIVLVLIGALFLNGKEDNNSNNNSNNTNQTTPTPTTASTSVVTPTTASVTQTVSPTPTPTTQSTPSTTTTPKPTSTSKETPDEVRVYFSVDPESMTQTGYVFYFEVPNTRSDAEAYAIEKIIAGPTAEQASEYKVFTPIKLSGASNCDGKDFKLTLDSAAEKATVQFCKDLALTKDGDAARVKSVLTNALKEFDDIETVIVQNKSGEAI